MSRYVTPASKHASKIGTLKSGSTAFRTASASVSRISRDDRLLARGVDRVRAEAAVVELGDERGRARGVVVGERAVLEERSPSRDLREGRPDTACSDDENPHGARVLHERRVSCSAADRRRYARPGFHRTEVARERVGHPAEAIHRRRVRRLDIWRDDGGPNPATGEVIAEVPRGTAEDVEHAVTAAKKAWDEWQGKTPKDRMELLLEARRRHRRERRGARAAGVPQRRQAVVGRGRRAAASCPTTSASSPARRATSRARRRPSTSRATRR